MSGIEQAEAVEPVAGEVERVAKAISRFTYATVGDHDDCGEWDQMSDMAHTAYCDAARAAIEAMNPATQAPEAAGVERARDAWEIGPQFPGIECGPEPGLERIVFLYYAEHFNALKAAGLTAQYRALSAGGCREGADGHSLGKQLRMLLDAEPEKVSFFLPRHDVEALCAALSTAPDDSKPAQAPEETLAEANARYFAAKDGAADASEQGSDK